MFAAIAVSALAVISTSSSARTDVHITLYDADFFHDVASTGLTYYDTGTVTFPLGTYAARAEANDHNGVLRSYLSVTQTPDVTKPLGRYFMSSAATSGDFVVSGSGTDPVDFTVTLDFDGKFSGSNISNAIDGRLGAYSLAGVLAPFYVESDLRFWKQPGKSIFAEVVSLSGATPIVFSETLDLVSGRVLLPLSMRPGERFHVDASILGIQSATRFEMIDGTSDAFNTGRMTFSVPTGYSLTSVDALGNPNGLFAEVVQVPVPEPDTYALMLAGLGLVAFVVRQGARRRLSLS